ncbi:MAG: histidine phosphatase family protein [Burkholderiaceae bacterium]
MTMLALLRHGDTAWSREGRIQGRTDTVLDAQGWLDLAARHLPARVAHWKLCSSPLLRCRQTAELVASAPPRLEPRLAEMQWGAWEGRKLQELRAELGDAMLRNEARGMDFTPPDGESPRQVLQRVRPWLAELADAGTPTVAVTHRGVIRVILALACGWDMTGKPPAKLDWRTLHLFSIDAQGVPHLEEANVALHPVDPAALTHAPGVAGE